MADMGADLFPEIAKQQSGAPSRRIGPPPASNATQSRSPSPPPRSRSAPPPPPSASKSKLPAAPRVRSTPPPPPSSKGLPAKSNGLPPPRASSSVAPSAPPRAAEPEITVDVDLSVGIGEDTPTQLALSPLDSEPDDENTPTRMRMPKDLALAKGRSVPEPVRPKLDNLEADDDEVDEPTRLVTRNQLAALPHMAQLPSRPTPPPPTKATPAPPAKLSAPPPPPRSLASPPTRPQSVPPPPPSGSRSPSRPPSPLASRPQSAPLPPLAPRPPSAPPAVSQRPAAPVAPRALPRLEAPLPPSMAMPASARAATSSPMPTPAIAIPLRSTPTPRTRPRLDTSPRSQPASYPPVAVGGSSPAPFSRRPARKNAIGAALVLLAAFAGAGAVFLSQDKPGTLIVTVSGPGNESVGGVEVIADDVARCEAAPCRVEDLTAGTHFVKVSAKGYAATAARAVAVQGGTDNAIHIELSRPIAPAAQTTSANVETPRRERKSQPDTNTVSLSELAPQTQQTAPAPVRAAPAPRRAAARDATKTPPAAASPAPTPKPAAVANGTLNLNSIPPATVVVDGRPVGPTPVAGLSVSPGAHTIVFVHPEKGRSVKMATVEPGETSAVVARF